VGRSSEHFVRRSRLFQRKHCPDPGGQLTLIEQAGNFVEARRCDFHKEKHISNAVRVIALGHGSAHRRQPPLFHRGSGSLERRFPDPQADFHATDHLATFARFVVGNWPGIAIPGFK
jgi:hypothetical protein